MAGGKGENTVYFSRFRQPWKINYYMYIWLCH